MMEEKNEVLKDYIRWRGDLSFDSVPFNKIDNLILSELCYVDFDQVLEQNSSQGITLKEAYRKICEKKCYQLLTVEGGQEDFVQAAADSVRFGNIILTHYVSVFDPDKTQFSAVHFELDPKCAYIAFRGTDNSIIGWKEDFMISFTNTPAQNHALSYVRETMRPHHQYYIGGHSKGGNLAVYAAAYLNEDERKSVIRVYMNDAPGFCSDVFDLERIRSVYPLITRVIPSYDVIGQLFFEPIEDTVIVKSVNRGILQHDLISWCVDGPHLKAVSELDKGCWFADKTFNDWCYSMPQKKRAAFVNEFFGALSVNGAVTMEEITSDGVKHLSDILKAMNNASQDAWSGAMALPKAAVGAIGAGWRQKISDAYEEFARKQNADDKK